MKKGVLFRIISLLLMLSILLSVVTILTGCLEYDSSDKTEDDESEDPKPEPDPKPDPKPDPAPEPDPKPDPVPDPDPTPEPDPNPSDDEAHKIIVPPYKDYGRDTVNFADMIYSRPDIETTIATFDNIISMIEAAEASFEDQITALNDIYPAYSELRTMYTLAEIHSNINVSDEYWAEEYAYLSTSYPKFVQVIENMYVAAANSPYAQRFEEEYFGEGLIEEYKNGGKYNDTIVELLAEEAELEAKYSSLSTSTIAVEYKHLNDTVDNILAYYESRYGADSKEFAAAYEECMKLFEEKYSAQSTTIFINLVRVRRLIADEFGYDSYVQIAYDDLGHDYTPEQASEFLQDIVDYVIPVYIELYSRVFYSIFERYTPSELSPEQMINTLYSILGTTDPELQEIYAYMLQHSLFNIDESSINRYEGAFTTYLEAYNAPFIFVSCYGNILDYTTLVHEFGHFADSYLNYDASAALDTLEISSQALELLMLEYISPRLSRTDQLLIQYSSLCSALETLLYQGLYARFEELVYELSYDDITMDNLNKIVVKVAGEFGFNTDYVNDVSMLIIPHIMLYPFYVQSYCTSVVPAVEIYYMEKEKDGAGFDAYKDLILREEYGRTFEEELESAGLTSPFKDGHLRDICNKIYYDIFGSYYFTDSDSQDKDAA